MNGDLDILGTDAPSPANLGGMSLGELLELSKAVDVALKAKQQEEKPRVLDQIQRLAAETDLSVDELVQHLGGSGGSKAGRADAKRRRIAPKYRDPENPANLWSGRGKRPKWLQQHLDDGGTLEDCLIDQADSTGGRS